MVETLRGVGFGEEAVVVFILKVKGFAFLIY